MSSPIYQYRALLEELQALLPSERTIKLLVADDFPKHKRKYPITVTDDFMVRVYEALKDAHVHPLTGEKYRI